MQDQQSQPKLRRRTLIIAIAVPVGLILIGAGCMSLGDRLGARVAAPVTVPVEALAQSKDTLSAVNATANEQADQVADDMTVAMIAADDTPASSYADQKTVGCGDHVAYAKVHRSVQTGQALPDALTTLFSLKDSSYDGLYDALWESHLKVDKVISRDGVTTQVLLTGKVADGGKCDIPRVKAQIEYTIKRLRSKYAVFLNGSESEYRCLGDTSGKCQ